MKHHVTLLAAFVVCCAAPRVSAQIPRSLPPGSPSARQNNGNRLFNPYHVEFEKAWTTPAPELAKLIEVAPISDSQRPNLLVITGATEKTDYRRKLMVTHWDGFRFATDASADFIGTAFDALLVGHFRVTPSPIIPVVAPTSSAVDAKGKPKKKDKPKPAPLSLQIVTTEGVYTWLGSNSLSRLFPGPPGVRLAFSLEGSPDQIVVGNGGSAVPFEVGQTDVHPSEVDPPASGSGYTRFGVGTQDFDPSSKYEIAPGVRYVQSFWAGKYRWVIGLARGKSANLPDEPNATEGDSLVIYTPASSARDKTFWETRPKDLEESWRSDPLPGRTLDVRVGDPKSDGRDGQAGIVVLTADTDKTRRLTYFAVKKN